MKTIKYLFIPFIALTIYSCGSEAERIVTELPAVKVKVERANSTESNSLIKASGTITSRESANLSTRMMGSVTQLHVTVGDKVKKGQVLLNINSADLLAQKAQAEAGITQAQSAYANAENDLKRFKSLYAKESASAKELEDMTTRFDMASANLEAAKQMRATIQAQFAYTSISAPFDGIITNSFIKVGDLASPGHPMLAIEGIANQQAVVTVSESEIINLEKGAEAQILIKSTNKIYNGKVIELSKSASNTGGQYMVKLSIENADDEVFSGMFINASIQSSSADANGSIISLPESALIKKGQLTGVYVVNEDKVALLRWLRLGKSTDGMVEVLSGLTSKESYVASSDGKLYNGVKVTF
jgi:RND family efflux transporter MFP subunit